MSIAKRLADYFVLRPSTDPVVYDPAEFGLFEVELSSGRLEAFVRQRIRTATGFVDRALPGLAEPPPEILIFKFPGAAGRAERSTPFPANLLEKSCEVWTWNAPGYGRSTPSARSAAGRWIHPPATLQSLAPAALEFVTQIVEKRGGRDSSGPDSKIWISGNSLGCAVGLYVATQLPVDALILRNPPPLVELISARDAWWNLGRGGRFVAGGVPAELDAILNATQITAPILFIESGADTLVPAHAQAIIRDSHPGPQRRLLLIGAAHDSSIDEAYKEELTESLSWLG